MQKFYSVAFFSLLITSSAVAGEWEWDIGENSVALGIADADWTINEAFTGTKVMFDAHYVFMREDGEGEDAHRHPEHLTAITDIDLQWGDGDTDLEIGKLTFTLYATQWDIKRDTSRKWKAVFDQLEFGVIQVGFDDPLGIDSYTEVTFVRAGRTWNYQQSENSSIVFGLKASLGWAWAESVVATYDDVSNPFSGFGMTLGYRHDTLGMIYTDDRVVVGYTLGSPASSGPTSREARIRFGYFNQFYRCLALDLFFEKRSFNFADAVLPDLYTKSKRIGAELACKF